jgi:hypothetical protein
VFIFLSLVMEQVRLEAAREAGLSQNRQTPKAATGAGVCDGATDFCEKVGPSPPL